MKKTILFLTIILLFMLSNSLFAQDDEYGLQEATNLGNPINTEEHNEFAATISADGKTLVFESNKVGGWKLFITNKKRNGWTKPELLNTVNSPESGDFDGGPFLTYDGNFIIITSDRDGGEGFTDIWISERLGEEWASPVNIGSPINTSEYQGFASMTSDGNEIFFMQDVINSDDSGYDIYSAKKVNGVWNEPERLPYPINSDASEAYPRILPDNKTLIFSSKREGGYGDYDLYKSERKSDGTWSEPINLGTFINTEEQDALISVPASGDIMYFTSGENNYKDIYSVPIPVEMQHSPLVTVTGTIFDAKTNEPLFANIKIINTESETDSTTIKSNKVDGKFTVLLNKGKNYDVSVSTKNYMFYSTTFDLQNITDYNEYHEDIFLHAIEVGEKIVLNNIYFKTNSATLLDESKYELNRVVALLNQNENMVVQIAGHTDNQGAKERNETLSTDRANSVVNYIINQGIDSKRLIVKGFGESKPIADNDSEEGRKKNRRVEFLIIKN